MFMTSHFFYSISFPTFYFVIDVTRCPKLKSQQFDLETIKYIEIDANLQTFVFALTEFKIFSANNSQNFAVETENL